MPLKTIVPCLFLLLFHLKGMGQCGCAVISQNLVVDGGFEIPCAVPTSFSSEMTLSCSANPWPIANHPNGVYNIGDGSIQSHWTGFPRNGNKYFVGDGPWGELWVPNSSVVWEQEVNVIQGMVYGFQVWHYEEQSWNPATILEVDGSAIATSVSALYTGQWISICGYYTALTTGPVQLGIRREGTQSGTFSKNDFGLDDVQFGLVLNPLPQPDQTICKGGAASLTALATGGSGNYSYVWSTGATTQQITVTPSTPTVYSVTITDNSTLCTVTDEIQVNFRDLAIDLGPDVSLCIAGPTVITAYPTGGSGSYSYLWNTGATTPSIGVNYSNPGTYTVTITDSLYGCTAQDEIYAGPSICQGIKLFQNTQSLPALNHYNNIKAGYAVDASVAPGDVHVLNGQNVSFKAANAIIVQEGFEVDPGGIFLGEITPGCSFGNIFITSNQIDYCTYRLSAHTAFGSGNYSYLWNTGATTQHITVSPSSNIMYSVQITDNCLGNSATSSYTVQPHYKGSFSYTYPNLVTPNGDGYNDKWILADNGKTEFAFNAYEAKVEMYNQWGAMVWSQTIHAPITSNGFKQGDLYWDPNNPYVSDAVYYGYVTLKNCDHNTTVVSNGWVQVIRSAGRKANDDLPEDTTGSDIHLNDRIGIQPNPSSGAFNYFTDLTVKVNAIKVFDMYGNEIKNIMNSPAESTVDMNASPDGIYFVHFLTDKGNAVKKLLLRRGN